MVQEKGMVLQVHWKAGARLEKEEILAVEDRIFITPIGGGYQEFAAVAEAITDAPGIEWRQVSGSSIIGIKAKVEGEMTLHLSGTNDVTGLNQQAK